MKIIDEGIMTALSKMRLSHDGKNIRLAEKLGLTNAYIGKIFKGKVNYFNDDTWKKIEPVLRPYIKDYLLESSHIAPCILADEDREILEYYKKPENKLKRYELLAEIERSKNNSGGKKSFGHEDKMGVA
ncbi:MAG: hypothetical protein JXR78_07650 [Victivallales bacterium]|nr:hypothetical protein [Victivallales bacterium]